MQALALLTLKEQECKLYGLNQDRTWIAGLAILFFFFSGRSKAILQLRPAGMKKGEQIIFFPGPKEGPWARECYSSVRLVPHLLFDTNVRILA